MPIYQSSASPGHALANSLLMLGFVPQPGAEFRCPPTRIIAFKTLILRRSSAQMGKFSRAGMGFFPAVGEFRPQPARGALVIERTLGHSEGDAATCGDRSGPRSRRRRACS